MRRDAVVFAVPLLSGLCALGVRPLWRAIDQQLAVAVCGKENLADLGVAIDPWGSPIVSPKAGGVFAEGEPREPLQEILNATQESTSPRKAHFRLAAVCNQLSERKAESEPAKAQLLEQAAAIALANAEQAKEVLTFGRKGPYPYRLASNPRAYYYTQLEPYSLGPNLKDELGHGDDVRYVGSAYSFHARLRLYERWCWLLPLAAALVLLSVLLASVILPVARSASRELAVAALLGGLCAWGVAVLLTELGKWNPSWETFQEALGLSTPLTMGWGRARGGIALLLGFCGALAVLFVRLPQLPNQVRVGLRQDAEREVSRLERELGSSDLRVADALEWLGQLAREDGDLPAAEEAEGRARRIRAAGESEEEEGATG